MPQMPETKGKWQNKKNILTYMTKGYGLIFSIYKEHIQVTRKGWFS